MTNECQVKVSDFGLSQGAEIFSSGDLVGTPWYMAPELFESTDGYTSKVGLLLLHSLP